MYLRDEPLINIAELAPRIGMSGPLTQVWLSEHGPESLGEFNYRELIVFAGQHSSSPWKACMGVWPSILTRWAGYAWERGDIDVAMHIIHTTLANVGRITAQKDWSRVLSELPPAGQRAVGAYLKQVDPNYWGGQYSPLPRYCRANLDAINAPSRFHWVTGTMLEGWSDQDILRLVSSAVPSSFARAILPVWLAAPETSEVRMSLLAREVESLAGKDDVARDALVGNMAATFLHAADRAQRAFFDLLTGAGALAALRAITQTRYTHYNVPSERQTPYLVELYNRLGATPWELHISRDDKKQLCRDLQRDTLLHALTPAAKRHLILLVLADGVDDAIRTWAHAALEEVGLHVGIMDVVASLGLRSWPVVVNMANSEAPAVRLPEMLLG